MRINGPVGRQITAPAPPIRYGGNDSLTKGGPLDGVPSPRALTDGRVAMVQRRLRRFQWPFSRRARYEVRLHLSPQPAFDLRIFVTRADNAALTEADIRYMRDLARTVRAIFRPLEETD